jgi:hypothetical protein
MKQFNREDDAASDIEIHRLYEYEKELMKQIADRKAAQGIHEDTSKTAKDVRVPPARFWNISGD